ncbi:MAG: hypothetical protein HRF45_12970 [Fimbriimonadia bacterium]|jgi:hypothetical protein
MNDYRKLGELLVSKGLISSLQLSIALAAQRTSSRRLGEILVERGFATEAAIAHCLAEQYGYPLLNLDQMRAQPEALALIQPETALTMRVLPLAVSGSTLECAICDPLDIQGTDAIARMTGRSLAVRIASQSDLLTAIRLAYGLAESLPEGVFSRVQALPNRFRNAEPRRCVDSVALFDAWDEVLERPVTLASVPEQAPEATHQFLLAKAAARVHSDTVAAVYDWFPSEGYRWTVFEHLEGENLQHVLRTRGARSIAQATQLVAALADGVDALNRKGGSCDIVCPANVLITPNGPLWVPLVRPPAEYLAPDRAGQVGAATSMVFPLGTLLWHCVTGSNPHESGASGRHWTHQYDDDQRLPLALREILARCLDADPERRFTSPLQLSQVLRSYSWSAEMPEAPSPPIEADQDRDQLLDLVVVHGERPSREPFWRRWLGRRDRGARAA